MTLTEFLEARIDEDESPARVRIFPIKIGEMRPPPYFEGALVGEHGRVEMSHDLCQRICEAMFPSFIEVRDPRMLAECDAKRRIVARHTSCDDTSYGEPCADLRALALPYAGHPDYQEEWKP